MKNASLMNFGTFAVLVVSSALQHLGSGGSDDGFKLCRRAVVGRNCQAATARPQLQAGLRDDSRRLELVVRSTVGRDRRSG